jgi:phosphomannomutase
MISVSGIRGIIGSGLTPDVATRYASSFAAWLPPGPVVLGRDSRPSGPALRHAVLGALLFSGREVLDLGIVPTPTVQLQVEALHAAGGIALTASHNPIEWNALKLIGPTGRFLTGAEGAGYLALAKDGISTYPAWNAIGRVVEVVDPLAHHLDSIVSLEFLGVEAIRRRAFRVALDAVHGAGGAIGRRLFERLGARADILFEEPTGLFPRPPEPLAENLGLLCRHVASGNYDVGFAFDPDVDRLSLVDETGRALGEEATLALCARFVLDARPGPVVTNLSTSAMVEAVARERGCQVFRTPVGEANVVEEIVRSGAPIGGEGNGGVILPTIHAGRDAPIGVALILGLMASTGKKLSELYAALPRLAMVKAKITLQGPPDLSGLTNHLMDRLPGGTLDVRDGIRVTRNEEWVHVRRSGTEPIVRIIAEARDQERADALKELALGYLEVSAEEQHGS